VVFVAIKASLFIPSQEVTISLESFFMTSSHPNRGRPAFCLALNGWLRRTIFCNLLPYIHKTCPSLLNLSFVVALESEIEPYFSYSLLFETLSVWVPRTIRRQFSGKTSFKFSSAFQSVHDSEPFLTTVITVASNVLILVCRLIFLFFQTFF